MDITDLSDLVQSQGKAIYGFCWTLTKNQTDSDDLYQDTFLKAMQLCHKINKDQNPKGFLISIAIGLWKNNRRKYARHQKVTSADMFNENINPCSGYNISVAVDSLFEPGQTGVSKMAYISEDGSSRTAVQFSRDANGVITGKIIKLN